jgi:hypothetical protein
MRYAALLLIAVTAFAQSDKPPHPQTGGEVVAGMWMPYCTSTLQSGCVISKRGGCTLAEPGPAACQNFMQVNKPPDTTGTAVTTFLSNSKGPTVKIFTTGESPDLIRITDEHDGLLIAVHMDGSVTTGAAFNVDETAKLFWQALADTFPPAVQVSGQSPAPGTTVALPQAEWVPDPGAGHYDCNDTIGKDGNVIKWTAYAPVEPEKWVNPNGPQILPLYIKPVPRLDKKGHVLREPPVPPICIQDRTP